MEHQSFNRSEPIPMEAREYLTEQPDPPPKRMGALAIDQVRAAGWYNYDREDIEL